MDPTLILQCRAPGLFTAKMIFREMFSALRKSGLLYYVTSRYVTFCDTQFIKQEEDTRWVQRTTMGELFITIYPLFFTLVFLLLGSLVRITFAKKN